MAGAHAWHAWSAGMHLLPAMKLGMHLLPAMKLGTLRYQLAAFENCPEVASLCFPALPSAVWRVPSRHALPHRALPRLARAPPCRRSRSRTGHGLCHP